MPNEPDLIFKQKKEHHVKGTRSSIIWNTHCSYRGFAARGWGGTLLRGTCHMLSESGLKQKPIKCKQDSQPGSQTLPRAGEGSGDRGEVDVCAGECLCGVFLLNEETVAVATF